MKKIATTQLLKAGEQEIYFNEYDDGSYKKVVDEVETDSSLEELQDMVNSGEYQVTELTF